MSSIGGASFYNPYSNPYMNASQINIGNSSAAASTGAPTDTAANSQTEVAHIDDQAKGSIANHTAKSFLLSLNTEQLSVLQHANYVADPIDVNSISEEGAENLLLDKDHRVDLNNDGYTEVGLAKLGQFPPPNASQAVKDAWNAATSGISDRDKMMYSFRFLGGGLDLLNKELGKSNTEPSLASQISSPNFNWTQLFNTVRYDIDLARHLNTPEFSDRFQAFADRFQTELKNRGLT